MDAFTILLLVAVLACPVMMWLMMRSHRNHGPPQSGATDRQKTVREHDREGP